MVVVLIQMLLDKLGIGVSHEIDFEGVSFLGVWLELFVWLVVFL